MPFERLPLVDHKVLESLQLRPGFVMMLHAVPSGLGIEGWQLESCKFKVDLSNGPPTVTDMWHTATRNEHCNQALCTAAVTAAW
jgi:hypothetical protein